MSRIKSQLKSLLHEKTVSKKQAFSVLLAVTLFMVLFFTPMAPVSAYDVIVDNNVDADSDEDATANLGDDGVTSYTDAQTQDGTDQAIVESDEGAGGGGVITNTGSAHAGATTGTAFSCDVSGLTINEDDVVLALMHQNDDLNDFTDNNGAYAFTEAYQDDGQDTHHYAIFYRVAGASEPTSYAFTSPNNDDWELIIRVFEGVNTTDIFDVTPSATTQNSYQDYSSGQTLTIDAITINKVGAVGVIFCFSDTGQTNVYSDPTNGYGNYTGATVGYPAGSYLKTHGSTGTTGSTEVTQTKSQDWTVNHFALKVADVVSSNYKLEWEHQASNMDIDKNYYELCVYAHSSEATEDFEIQMWNYTSSAWSSALASKITESETWLNQSIDKYYVDNSTQEVTWRYRGDSETDDTTQTTLNIDYAGIKGYNFSVNIIEASVDLSSYDPGSGWIIFDSTPFSIDTSSGVTYDLEIKGVDGSGSPIANEYLCFDTDSNPAGGTNLSTAYQTLYSSQSAGEVTLYFYLFVAVPFGVGDQEMTFTLFIQIVKS